MNPYEIEQNYKLNNIFIRNQDKLLQCKNLYFENEDEGQDSVSQFPHPTPEHTGITVESQIEQEMPDSEKPIDQIEQIQNEQNEYLQRQILEYNSQKKK